MWLWGYDDELAAPLHAVHYPVAVKPSGPVVGFWAQTIMYLGRPSGDLYLSSKNWLQSATVRVPSTMQEPVMRGV